MHDTDKQLDELIDKHERAWRSGYSAFPSVVRQRGLARGVEVGVAFGGHSEAILSTGVVDKLFGVDSYRHRDGYDDPMNLPQPVFDRLAQRVIDRLKAFGERFELVREDSVPAGVRFEDGSLDFVYLDADHSEEGVSADLCTWAVKVREGGVIAGHDYGHRDFPGVKRAVDRFFARLGWPVHEAGHGVWWVERRPLSISFFTPCYNCESWVRDTTHSILDTNLQPGDEYILVDDGSTDQTAELLREIADKHPAVRVITHDQNRGGSAARNTAVAAARHPLLFCLDSDNLLLPDSMARLRGFLLKSGADVAAFQTLEYFNDGDDHSAPSHCLTFPDVIYDFDRVLQTTRMPGASGNYLFTKLSWQKAEGYPRDAGALDAWGFGFRQCASGSVLRVLPGSSYRHRYGHNSYWTRQSNAGTINRDALSIIRPYFDRLHPADVRYLCSRKGRESWFTRLNDRPLRQKSEPFEINVHIRPGQWLHRLARIIRPAA